MRIEQRMPGDDEIKRARVDNLLTAIRLDQSLSAPLPGERMSKFKTLAARGPALKQKLEALADAAMADLDYAEKEGPLAIAAIGAQAREIKEGVDAIKDTVNQMTNGGPPLSDSQTSSEDGKTG